MNGIASDSRDLLQLAFWGAVAFVADQALRRRRLLRRIARYAPLTAGAATAYLIGCFVGAAVVTYLP